MYGSFRVFLKSSSSLLPQGKLAINYLLILKRFTIFFVTNTFKIAFEIQNLHEFQKPLLVLISVPFKHTTFSYASYIGLDRFT